MAFGFVIAAFLLFAVGSIAMAHGSAVVTRALGLSPLGIGLIVIGATVSLPVLFVLWRAKTLGAPDLAVGGVVGGAIFALTVILGVCALVRPLECPPKVMGRDIGALLAASMCFLVLSLMGASSRLAGMALLAIFAVHMGVTYASDRRRAAEHSVPCAHAKALDIANFGTPGGIIEAALGAIAILLGAHLAVTAGIGLSWQYGVPQYVVGLTVVAALVAIPSFLVVFAGAKFGRSNILVGYAVLGSVINLCWVLGLCMVFFPIKLSPVFAADGAVLAAICVLFPGIAVLQWRLSRPRGVLLVAGYGLYLCLLTLRMNLLSLSLPWF